MNQNHTTRSTLAGPSLTHLGFGAAQLGNLYRITTDDTAHQALADAWNNGIRYFDTAPHYGLGLSERRVGAYLSTQPRGDYVLSTKVGRILEPSPHTAHLTDDQGFEVPAATTRRLDYSYDGIMRSVEDSLNRLRTDYIDIAYLHDPDEHWDTASTEGVRALNALKDQGIIKAWGAGMNQSAMLARFITECGADIVMCAGRYTLLEQPALDDLIPAAQNTGAGIVIAGVYNSGILARDSVSNRATYNYGDAPTELIERARAIADICAQFNVTLPQAALAFVRAAPNVVSTVVGMRTADHVHDTVARMNANVPTQLWQTLVDEHLLSSRAPLPH